MASKWDHVAAYDIIGYLWDQLIAEEVLDANDYFAPSFGDVIRAIIPVQELPELQNELGDVPYIIYDTMTLPTYTDEWWINRDEYIFTIYSTDVNKVNEIKNFITDKFRKMDKSASELNASIGNEAPFRFLCIELITASVSGETEDEGGRVFGEIIISADYVRDLDADGAYT